MADILMIHGSASSGRFWKPFVTLLGDRANDRQIAAPDLPGAGKNPVLERGQPGGLDADIEALLPAIDGLGDEVDIVGHSYGGLLALRLALLRPQKTRQVIAHEFVCWQALARFGTPQDIQTLEAFSKETRLLSEDYGGTEGWTREFLEFWNGPTAWTSLPPRFQQHTVARAWKSFLEVRDVFADTTLVDRAATFPVPVRITTGTHSPAAARRVLTLFAPHFPDARLQPIPGGHLAPMTHPEGFAKPALQWLDNPHHDGHV